MTFTSKCPGCQVLLELDAAPKGSIRCPACGHQFRIDEKPEIEPAAVASLRIPEGRIYGPMPIDQLEEWVCQGRVDDRCDVRLTSDGPWQAAATIFPALRLPATLGAGNPFAAPDSPDKSKGSTSSTILTERGALIVLFGVLGWIGCPVFGVLAWGMGAADLEAFRAGKLDARSTLLTHIGYFLGMFAAIAWGTAILGTVLAFLTYQLVL
ncbi:MAG: hypothetical protein ACIALR_09685 [Blastopirellula sp. JB062]